MSIAQRPGDVTWQSTHRPLRPRLAMLTTCARSPSLRPARPRCLPHRSPDQLFSRQRPISAKQHNDTVSATHWTSGPQGSYNLANIRHIHETFQKMLASMGASTHALWRSSSIQLNGLKFHGSTSLIWLYRKLHLSTFRFIGSSSIPCSPDTRASSHHTI